MRTLNCVVITLIVLLTGCASTPQAPISLTKSHLEATDKVVVVATAIPEPGMTYPGASCLLCLAAAATANSALSSYSKELPNDDFKTLKLLAEEKLRLHGVETEVLDSPIDLEKLGKNRSKAPNTAKYDFSRYRHSHGATHVAVVDINAAGMTRTYSAYVPAGPPQAYVSGATYLVDLDDHTYTAYQPLSAYRGAEGEWKEKPDFPGLTNAYFQAIESVRDTIKTTYVGKDRPVDTVGQSKDSGSPVADEQD